MAQPNLIAFSRRGLLFKRRSPSAGDVEVDPGISDAYMLFNGQSGTEIDVVERPLDRPFLGGTPFAVGNKRAFIEGEIELRPPASPGQASNGNAWGHVMLLCAGFNVVRDAAAKTTVYNPASGWIVGADAIWYHGGMRRKVNAARNLLSSVTMEIGKPFKANLRIEGVDGGVVTSAIPDLVFPESFPTLAAAGNTTATITANNNSAVDVWAKSLVLDTGNQVALREYTTYFDMGITARQPTWTMRLSRTALGDFNPWLTRDRSNTVEVAFRMKEPNSNRYSQLGIRGQIEQINEIDIDGDYGWELSGRCIPSGSGGDEFYLEFGDTTP